MDKPIREILLDAWNEYRAACYGSKPLSNAQYTEVRRAFLSGLHWMINYEDKNLSEASSPEAVDARVDDLKKGIYTLLMESIKNLPDA